MAYQATFQRYETKYLLTALEKEQILKKMSAHMRLDAYGRTTIRNVYFDTDSYRLIRRSLEKPVYNEKLRMRSYQAVGPEDPVFVELKKKFQSVVYKRRLVLPAQEAMTCFRRGTPLPAQSQIAREIEYFRAYYQSLHPAVFLSYEREAYYALDGSDFRITLDENILYRQNDLWLGSNVYGYPLLRDGYTLMEVKTSGGFPLWMSHTLARLYVYQTSFSKYGAAYQHMMTNQGGLQDA